MVHYFFHLFKRGTHPQRKGTGYRFMLGKNLFSIHPSFPCVSGLGRWEIFDGVTTTKSQTDTRQQNGSTQD